MSVMYTYPSLLHLTSLQIKRNPGTHQKYDVTSQTPKFLCTVKGGRPRQGVEKVAIGQFGDSFLGQIDREAVTRMSGRHLMNPIN